MLHMTKMIESEFDILDVFSSNLEGILEFMEEAPSKLEVLSQQMSEIDLELTDIHHYIECVNFNAYEGYKLAKEMKSILDRRSIIKNEQTRLSVAYNNFSQIVNANKVNKLHNSISKRKEQQENPTYSPRIRVDMFEKIKHRSNVKINIK